MTDLETAVADMQAWVFRKAQQKWNVSAPECAKIFRKYGVFGYISELYDLLHLNGYDAALEDVENFIRSRGGSV